MNESRDEKKYAKFLKKDSVVFLQEIVNKLNEKTNREDLLGSDIDIVKHSIPKDSLQLMLNRYNTKGMSGIGFVQIIECFYKPKKETTIWYVFFDIASKKLLDAYEVSNKDADSYHGLADYWAVGVGSGMGFYLSDHYSKMRKDFAKTNK